MWPRQGYDLSSSEVLITHNVVEQGHFIFSLLLCPLDAAILIFTQRHISLHKRRLPNVRGHQNSSMQMLWYKMDYKLLYIIQENREEEAGKLQSICTMTL